MCMEVIDRKSELPKTGTFWKLFRKVDGKLYPQYGTIEIIKGKWLKEKDYRERRGATGFVRSCIRGKYLLGFHGYVKRYNSEYYVTKKVKFRTAVAIGYGSGDMDSTRTIVAKEIFIPMEDE